jgi:hypothetical protein
VTNINEPMTAYIMAIKDANAAFARAGKAADRLPALPDSGCSCGTPDELLIEEFGYARWTTLRRTQDDSGWICVTDGWDDMTEVGTAPQVVWCRACDMYYQFPDDLDWI